MEIYLRASLRPEALRQFALKKEIKFHFGTFYCALCVKTHNWELNEEYCVILNKLSVFLLVDICILIKFFSYSRGLNMIICRRFCLYLQRISIIIIPKDFMPEVILLFIELSVIDRHTKLFIHKVDVIFKLFLLLDVAIF